MALCAGSRTHIATCAARGPGWTTTDLADALDALRGEGFPVTDEATAHLTPAQHDHINFYGTYDFDIKAELRREGHRPLRVPA